MQDKNAGKLGLMACAAILVGGMFGSAIFSLSGVTIAMAGPAAILSWVIAAVILFLYGLLTAELSTIFPNSGGVFMFPALSLGKNRRQGRVWGWVSSWAYLFGSFGGAAFSAIYVGIYLGVAFPSTVPYQIPISIAVVVLCGLLNVFKITVAGKASTALTVSLVVAMLVFVGAGLFSGNWQWGNLQPFFTQGTGGALGFMSAVPLAMVAYSSIVAAAFMVGEIRNPKKTVPKAMSLAMGVVLSLYVLIMLTTLGLISAVQLLDMGMEYVPLFAAAYTALSNLPWMPYLISVAAVLALINNIMVFITLLSRTVQATASSGILPKKLAQNGRGGTPIYATLVVTLVLMVLASFPGAINFLIGMGTLCSAIVVVAICLSILAARKKNPGKSTFHAPGGSVLPKVMMAVILVCYIPDIFAGGWVLWACTLGYFAVGMVIYWISARRRATREPALGPGGPGESGS